MQSASSWNDSYRDSSRLFIWSSFRFSTFVNFSCRGASATSPPGGLGPSEGSTGFLEFMGGRPPSTRMLSPPFSRMDLLGGARSGWGTGEGTGSTPELRSINRLLRSIGLVVVSGNWDSLLRSWTIGSTQETASSSSASLCFFVFFFFLFFLAFFFGSSSLISWTFSKINDMK